MVCDMIRVMLLFLLCFFFGHRLRVASYGVAHTRNMQSKPLPFRVVFFLGRQRKMCIGARWLTIYDGCVINFIETADRNICRWCAHTLALAFPLSLTPATVSVVFGKINHEGPKSPPSSAFFHPHFACYDWIAVGCKKFWDFHSSFFNLLHSNSTRNFSSWDIYMKMMRWSSFCWVLYNPFKSRAREFW